MNDLQSADLHQKRSEQWNNAAGTSIAVHIISTLMLIATQNGYWLIPFSAGAISQILCEYLRSKNTAAVETFLKQASDHEKREAFHSRCGTSNQPEESK